jgi:exodeoxyribonuclease VII small subunit
MTSTLEPLHDDPFPVIDARAPAPVVDYGANYKRLQEIVDRLKRGGPSDIDSLVESFRSGVAAYESCRSRLDSIRAEIDGEIARLAPTADVS